MADTQCMKNLRRLTYAVHFVLACVVAFGLLQKTVSAQTPTKETSRGQLEGKLTAPLLAEGEPPPKNIDPRQDPLVSFRSAKLIFVRSSSLLVGKSVVEEKLQKRPEFKSLGLMITRDIDDADLVLELKHDLFTMYVYTAFDPKTSLVVASGKLSSLGGTVAGKVAKRFMKQLVKARAGLSQ
jgi:hypothetical protein